MIRETDGDSFEKMRSLNQDLTFETAESFFVNHKLDFGDSQKRTLGFYDEAGLFTNTALLLFSRKALESFPMKKNAPCSFEDFQAMKADVRHLDFQNQILLHKSCRCNRHNQTLFLTLVREVALFFLLKVREIFSNPSLFKSV